MTLRLAGILRHRNLHLGKSLNINYSCTSALHNNLKCIFNTKKTSNKQQP